MNELKAPGKPFAISKWEVWEAYLQVKANKGAPGVDGCSIEDFEADLKNNLYRVWNRMSSGSYFPPPVKAVEIPKPHGGGREGAWPTVARLAAEAEVSQKAPPEPSSRTSKIRNVLRAAETTRRTGASPPECARRRTCTPGRGEWPGGTATPFY